MKLQDICKQHTIVGEDGVNRCDTENCPFAKQDLGIDFMPMEHYSCIADYPYLKENHETDTLKEFAVYVTSVHFQRKFFRENYTFYEILLMLNNDIENFIKEREK